MSQPPNADHNANDITDQLMVGAEAALQPVDAISPTSPPSTSEFQAPTAQMVFAVEPQVVDSLLTPTAHSQRIRKSAASDQTPSSAPPNPYHSSSTPTRTNGTTLAWTPRLRADGTIDRRSLRQLTPAQRTELVVNGVLEKVRSQPMKRPHARQKEGPRNAEGYLLKPDGSRDRRSARILDEARKLREGSVEPSGSFLARRREGPRAKIFLGGEKESSGS